MVMTNVMSVDVGLYVPSAGGRQEVLFVVSQDEETNQKLGKIKKMVES